MYNNNNNIMIIIIMMEVSTAPYLSKKVTVEGVYKAIQNNNDNMTQDYTRIQGYLFASDIKKKQQQKRKRTVHNSCNSS